MIDVRFASKARHPPVDISAVLHGCNARISCAMRLSSAPVSAAPVAEFASRVPAWARCDCCVSKWRTASSLRTLGTFEGCMARWRRLFNNGATEIS